jgi:hypothetical protein
MAPSLAGDGRGCNFRQTISFFLALASVLLISACSVSGKSSQKGFDEEFLIARDSNGRALNTNVYRVKHPVTYEIYNFGVCSVGDIQKPIGLELRGRTLIENSVLNLTRTAAWSKYYRDIAPKLDQGYEFAYFFYYRRCRIENGFGRDKDVKFATININRVSSMFSDSDDLIEFNQKELIARYYKLKGIVCEIRLKLDRFHIIGSNISYVSKGERGHDLPLLNEPDQLACIYRGVLATFGYFGYLNMPVSQILDSRLSNYGRSPIMVDSDITLGLAKEGFWPFSANGLSIDTDKLRPPLGSDAKLPGDSIGK